MSDSRRLRSSARASAGFCWWPIWACAGHKVRLHDIDDASSPIFARAAASRSKGWAAASRRSKCATTDLAAIVDGADVIIVVDRRQRQETVASSLAPLLRDGQIDPADPRQYRRLAGVAPRARCGRLQSEDRSRRDGQLSAIRRASSARRRSNRSSRSAGCRSPSFPGNRIDAVFARSGRCSRPRSRRRTSSTPASSTPMRCCMSRTASAMRAHRPRRQLQVLRRGRDAVGRAPLRGDQR